MKAVLGGMSLVLLLTVISNSALAIDNENVAISECLERFGGITYELSERLQRYKQWSDTYEEIPCFTSCYLGKVMDFFNETSGFDEDKVIKQFGRPVFNACKHRMTAADGGDSCQLAYKGFHCLVNFEDDPFVLIENMNLSTVAKTAMQDCLKKFDQYELQHFREYSEYPVREPMPCFTKCFIDKLNLFSKTTRSWTIADLQENLGVPKASADYQHCLPLSRRRNRNVCAWVYREFTCFAMAR